MGKWILLAIAFLAGGASGYAVRDNSASRKIIPISMRALVGDQLGCKTQASATLFMNPFDNAIEAESGSGSDSIALKIDSQAKQLSFLTAAAVRFGATEGDQFTIVHEDSRRVSAIHVNEMGSISSIIVVRDKGFAIWTRVADALLSNAQAYVLQCS